MQTFKEFGEFILKHSHHNEVPSNWVHMIVNYPKIEWDRWAEYMATLTWFTGIPLRSGGSKNNHVIFAETIDEGMKQVGPYEYCIVSYIGSYYYSVHGKNIHTCFQHFQEMGHACRGHLLFHPDKPYGRLHPQTIFINLNHWRSIGSPSFGKFTGNVINYTRSTSNVHDDYTPHWVRKGEGTTFVEDQEMAQYVCKVLESGETILNFDVERTTKFFCYPERRTSKQLDAEVNRNNDIVYARNNERLKPAPSDKKYDVIYAPASGSLSEYLYKIYGHTNTKLVIYDYNPNAVHWKRMVYSMAENTSDLERIAKHFTSKGCVVDAISYKQDTVTLNEILYSEDEWLSDTKRIHPEFIVHNVIDSVLNVDPTKNNLIHLSNIFSYAPVIHKYTIDHLHNKFTEYTNLPNTTVIGTNIFKDPVYNENCSSKNR